MENNIKEKVIEWISMNSSPNLENFQNCSAMIIAEQLNVSRSLVSQYCNEFHMYKTLVKINTRPVYYLSKKSLTSQIDYLQDTYDSLEELKKDLNKANSKSVSFIKLIGNNGSLNSIVQSCKSSITYPGNGLPILLLGQTGVGKSLLAQMMYEYGKEKGVFKQESRFITVNCSEYANNPELFLTNIFGCKKGAYTGADKDREGIISLANGGLLFLDEVHSLSNECQEKLFLFMDKGIYHMVGDNDKWYSADEHLVFATTEDPKRALLKTLFRRIPIVTRVPSLLERPKQEKKELLIYFLEKEMKQINMDIQISKRLYDTLSDYNYPENVGQLVNCIKACIGNSFIEKEKESEKILQLDIRHLPEYMIEECSKEGLLTQYSDGKMVTVEELKKENIESLKLYSFNEDIIQYYDEVQDINVLLLHSKKRFRLYLDSISYNDKHNKKAQSLLYHNVIEYICTYLGNKYQLKFSNNEVINLTNILSDYVMNIHSCEKIIRKDIKKINDYMNKIKKYNLTISDMSIDYKLNIKKMLNIELNEIGELDSMIYLWELSKKIEARETRCIILSHGYSTASSMATVINHMIGANIFDSIDMPMDVNVITIAKRLSEFISEQENMHDLIILVDMGALEDIYKRIVIDEPINIILFNNVTMKLALDVGLMVNQNQSLRFIKENIDYEKYYNHSILIENRKKEKAILTVCATGIATAEKIASLIEKSLPNNRGIKFITESYQTLSYAKTNAEVFEKYDVLFIVGTINPGIEKIMFISIEDMIEKQNISKIKNTMDSIFNDEEIENFTMNIIKNFSLHNLLDYLTILNPEKIVNYVEDIIFSIQENLQVNLTGNAIAGLYLHISCLIERLITDKYITEYNQLDTFILENKNFIDIVKKSFKNLEKSYCVEIPVSEIAYIYDYIYNYPSVENCENSVEKDFFC